MRSICPIPRPPPPLPPPKEPQVAAARTPVDIIASAHYLVNALRIEGDISHPEEILQSMDCCLKRRWCTVVIVVRVLKSGLRNWRHGSPPARHIAMKARPL